MSKKTRKKATRSRKPRARARTSRKIAVTEDGLAVGSVRPAGQETYLGAGVRGTKYQAVIDSLKALKKGESFPLTPPKGTSAGQLHARLGVIFDRAIKSGEIKVPAGCRIRKRTVAGTDTIEIALLPVKA